MCLSVLGRFTVGYSFSYANQDQERTRRFAPPLGQSRRGNNFEFEESQDTFWGTCKRSSNPWVEVAAKKKAEGCERDILVKCFFPEKVTRNILVSNI